MDISINKVNNLFKKEGKREVIGRLFTINYMFVSSRNIKNIKFIGLCTIYNKKSNTIVIKNKIKKEIISLSVKIDSPLIIKLYKLKKYKTKFRLNTVC